MAGSEVGADLWVSEYITPWDIYVHGITEVLTYKKTAYQDMYIIDTGIYGKALVLDGKWQSSTGDEFLYHEPLVHPAMIFHGSPSKVLVLGGGEGATIREVLRWQTVEKVAMIDIDGEVVEACRQYLPEMHANSFDDPRLKLVIGDALEFLETSGEIWDVVISDLSDPIEEGPSFQLFTKEYFEKILQVLTPGGFFVVQAGPVSLGEMKLHTRIVNTMKEVFPYVQSYSSYVPTYGQPWGFVMGSREMINSRPDPETVNQLLREKTTGGFRMLDGTTLLGMLQVPKHLREAIATETEVYTLAKPPKFFGKGSTNS
ncbi:MAG: polyamine aminopropyltransferase [Okeania sp. SIO2G4]|uniref:polyamine aminopropyltransferase n=1 Tax=unclassified Okeania TaxID=2634635 RepID=UPI0013BBDE0F|nr:MULTISPECIES: polyamine aminopropyltransferase [unclassified Okeania]NEP73388.1 polyamine aminopropyltransferase [Okeania sp. SIO2G5]NEP96892.1 polyamine aminopropyltransferase [Okeania sp. SIO2F5]NEQ94006.1 polyamine aminopropyltransferase [Okeania sp. SIO2G4]